MGDLSSAGMSTAFLVQLALTTGDPEGLDTAPQIRMVRAAPRDAAGADRHPDPPPPVRGSGGRLATLAQVGFVAIGLDDGDMAEAVYRQLLPTATHCATWALRAGLG